MLKVSGGYKGAVNLGQSVALLAIGKDRIRKFLSHDLSRLTKGNLTDREAL